MIPEAELIEIEHAYGQGLRVEVPDYLRLCQDTDKRIPPPSAPATEEADVEAAVAKLRLLAAHALLSHTRLCQDAAAADTITEADIQAELARRAAKESKS